MAPKGGKKRALPWASTPEVIDLTGDAPASSGSSSSSRRRRGPTSAAPPASKSRKISNPSTSSNSYQSKGYSQSSSSNPPSSFNHSYSSQSNGLMSSSMTRDHQPFNSQNSALALDDSVFDEAFFESDWDDDDEMDVNATQSFANMNHFCCYGTIYSKFIYFLLVAMTSVSLIPEADQIQPKSLASGTMTVMSDLTRWFLFAASGQISMTSTPFKYLMLAELKLAISHDLLRQSWHLSWITGASSLKAWQLTTKVPLIVLLLSNSMGRLIQSSEIKLRTR